MVVEMTEREAQIERECVEWVFGLTGGELMDRPWVVVTLRKNPEDADVSDEEMGEPYTNPYWYSGVPKWVAREIPHQDVYDFRTIVRCVSHGGAYARLWDPFTNEAWELVETFTSSGETQCPLHDVEDAPETAYENGRCVYCEAERITKRGEDVTKHGHIYLGDGWAELVYRRVVVHHRIPGNRATTTWCGIEVSDLRDEDVTSHYNDATCEACDNAHDEAHAAYKRSGPGPEKDNHDDSMRGYHRFVSMDENDIAFEYGSFEVFHSDILDHEDWIDEDGNFLGRGWYWVAGFPGCLWDGEPNGPYDTSRAAYDAAHEES